MCFTLSTLLTLSSPLFTLSPLYMLPFFVILIGEQTRAQTLTCTTCVNSYFYVVGCTEDSMGECTGCDACPAGTYRIGCGGTSPGVCKTCAACPFPQYAIGCTLESEGSCVPCEACPVRQVGWSMYRGACYGIKPGICYFCDFCPNGYFRSGCNETSNSVGTCEQCKCPAGQYNYAPGIACSVYSQTAAVCVDCDFSMCSPGQYLLGCSGTFPGVCVNCPAGKYLPGRGTNASDCVTCNNS